MRVLAILAGAALLAAMVKRQSEEERAEDETKVMPVSDKRRAFVTKIWAQADAVARALGWKRDLIITQAAHESAWGTSQLAATYNNLFGFTDGGWKKKGLPTVDLPTTEWVEGKAVKVTRAFRTYGSWSESMQDWARLLQAHPRYAPAVEALKAGDAQKFFDAMQTSGYATDPKYGQKLAGVFASVERASV